MTNVAIDRLFRALRSEARAPSQNLFRVDREAHDGSVYSAICFSYERSPAFLDSNAGAVERVFGFLLVVEKAEFIAVMKAGLDLPSFFKSAYLDKVGNERVERAVARHDAVFEKLRLKNMSTSKLALRSKSLEARDLENAVATSSASRYVPQGYSVRRPDGNYSATPGTGRISTRADRAGYEEIVEWAGEIIDLLGTGGGVAAPFIRNFARPLELAAIPRNVRPTYMAVDVLGLADLLFEEDPTIRFVREEAGAYVELTKNEIEPILSELDESLPIQVGRSEISIRHPETGQRVGAVRVGKTRISLPGFELAATQGVFVEDRTLPIGTDPDRKPLARYIDREDLFTVLFSDLALAYIDGGLYRDEALLDGGANFLRHLQIAPILATATSEKGAFAANQDTFAPQSVFRAVVDEIAHDADVLVCDDLGDEWADFIGISTLTNPSMISFYHAKHGGRSLSASAFHDSVGQAIKNLGRMSLPEAVMPAKLTSWEGQYRNDGIQTAIARLIRGGNRAEITLKIDDVRTAPDLLKRVFIVTSSLSRSQVEAAFQSAAAGHAPSAHFVQLYWLLMSYFSACAEVGAIGYVVCQS
ncbi:MAG: hypothetical protein ACJ8ER_15760 [Allosphingosinicella sp.]